MPLISPIIKGIVQDNIPNGIYMRNTELEANTDLDQVNMEGKTIVIYSNLPDVDNEAGQVTNYVIRSWPVEILVVKLANMDDNTDDGDSLRGECMAIADQIYDLLSKNNIVALTHSIEDYKILFENTVKIYDKTLTGCRMTCTVPISRDKYYCN